MAHVPGTWRPHIQRSANAPLMEVFALLERPGQIRRPTPKNTDAPLGFSETGYGSAEISPDSCEASREVHLLLERNVSEGRQSSKNHSMT